MKRGRSNSPERIFEHQDMLLWKSVQFQCHLFEFEDNFYAEETLFLGYWAGTHSDDDDR